MLKTALLCANLFLQTGSASAPPKDIAPLLQPIIEKHKIPGLAGAVVKGWDLVAIGACGTRRREGDAKVTTEDLWHLGSCTKSMTATLAAMMVEEKKLAWNLTLEKAFPEFASRIDAAFKPVTLEQLLTHRAGVPSDLSADGLWGKLWNHNGKNPEQRMALVEGVLTKPPVHAPGGKYLYANAGFAIAGSIAERSAKKSWEDLIQEKLFQPLGIKTAGFGAPGSKDKVDQPRGHRDDGPAVEPGKKADNPAAIGPGGTVHMSIRDWAKYVALHLRGAQGEPKLLTADSFKKLHAPAKGEDAQYAMGWVIAKRPWAEGTVLTHSGSNTMWYAVTWIAPKKNFAVLVCCNQGGELAAKACDEAAWALIQDHLAER